MIVYYGDILSNINLTELVRVHRSSKTGATLVLSKGYKLPVGAATVEDGLVKSMLKKPSYDINVTVGNLVVSRKSISTLMRMTKKTP